MFGIKLVRNNASITYLCHTYLITTFKILYRVSADMSDFRTFLLPNIGIGISPKIPYRSGPTPNVLPALTSGRPDIKSEMVVKIAIAMCGYTKLHNTTLYTSRLCYKCRHNIIKFSSMSGTFMSDTLQQ